VPPVASISTFGSEELWCDAADEEYVTFKNSVVGTSRACRVGAAVASVARQRLLVIARRERMVVCWEVRMWRREMKTCDGEGVETRLDGERGLILYLSASYASPIYHLHP